MRLTDRLDKIGCIWDSDIQGARLNAIMYVSKRMSRSGVIITPPQQRVIPVFRGEERTGSEACSGRVKTGTHLLKPLKRIRLFSQFFWGNMAFLEVYLIWIPAFSRYP
jgi:hypothetical protein